MRSPRPPSCAEMTGMATSDRGDPDGHLGQPGGAEAEDLAGHQRQRGHRAEQDLDDPVLLLLGHRLEQVAAGDEDAHHEQQREAERHEERGHRGGLRGRPAIDRHDAHLDGHHDAGRDVGADAGGGQEGRAKHRRERLVLGLATLHRADIERATRGLDPLDVGLSRATWRGRRSTRRWSRRGSWPPRPPSRPRAAAAPAAGCRPVESLTTTRAAVPDPWSRTRRGRAQQRGQGEQAGQPERQQQGAEDEAAPPDGAQVVPPRDDAHEAQEGRRTAPRRPMRVAHATRSARGSPATARRKISDRSGASSENRSTTASVPASSRNRSRADAPSRSRNRTRPSSADRWLTLR